MMYSICMSVLCCSQFACQCCVVVNLYICVVLLSFCMSVLKSICMSVLCCNLSVFQRYVVDNLHVSAVL